MTIDVDKISKANKCFNYSVLPTAIKSEKFNSFEHNKELRFSLAKLSFEIC